MRIIDRTKIKYYGVEDDNGSYSKEHHKNGDIVCDKCLKAVGEENLKEVDFLFLDLNDRTHPIVIRKNLIKGYHLYKVCKSCMKKGV